MNDIRCTIEGCEQPKRSRGWCYKHYLRWRKHGDPLFTLVPNRGEGTNDERFWAKVDINGVCWEWEAARNAYGYGRFNDGTKVWLSHRYAWTTLVGPIADERTLDHLCRNPPCVNPDHLEPVTHAENIRRGIWGIKARNRSKNAKMKKMKG